MALSKRLRYEILRRDNHACRYCGATAPDVKLTVDHVVPVALGGSDEASNLVTACAGCNSGKTSSSPDAPIVEDVTADAIRWASAMERAAEIQRRKQDEIDQFLRWFHQAWEDAFAGPYYIAEAGGWHYKKDPDRRYEWAVWSETEAEPVELFDHESQAIAHKHQITNFVPLPEGWKKSAEIWYTAGLRIKDLFPLMESSAQRDKVARHEKWRYFCGAVWGVIRQRQDIAQAILIKEELEP